MKASFPLSWILLFLNIGTAVAQFPGNVGNTGQANTPAPREEVESDSINVLYFYQDNPGLLYSYSDTLLNNRLEQYDPARQRRVDHAQLGNLGTAILPQLFETRSHRGLDYGFHQYDLYRIHYKEIPFYKVKKPFSDLYFAQGPTQQDTYFKGRFTRDFGERLNFSVDYKRMNNQGQFKSIAAINTALGIGFWYHHENEKYDAFINYVSNTNDVTDNGGIDIAALTETNTDRVFNIPVFLRSAQTYYVDRSFIYSHQYNLLGRSDSIRNTDDGRKLLLSHDLVFNKKSFKFYDTNPPADTIYYKHLQVDDRGLRYFINDNSIANTFAISTSKNQGQSQRDLLKVSLEHRLHFLEQEPRDSTINHLLLGGQWNFSPSENLLINTYLNYNLLANFGDYELGGTLFFDFKKAGNFQASIRNQLYSPSLVQQQMYITEQLLWQNNFDKTFETSLTATYSLPKLGFKATGQYHLISNFIYFDTLAFPRQIGTPVNILQLILDQNFKVSHFHLDNTVAFQASTEDVVRLPSFFTKHNLYYEGKVFGETMLLRVGMDLRLVNDYLANYYQPLIGQFHLQNSQNVKLYPAVDAYISFKVKHFRFFLKAENLTQLTTNDLYYQAAGYAQPYMTIKFGVSWQLLN